MNDRPNTFSEKSHAAEDSQSDDTVKEGIRKQAKRIADNCDFSANAQFESSKLNTHVHYVLGTVSTMAATAGGLGFLSGTSTWWWTLLALLAGVSSFWSTAGDHSGKAARSEVSGHNYVWLRNRVNRFIDVDLDGLDVRQAKSELDEFLAEEDRMNLSVSLASDRAYAKGKKTIEERR